MGLYYFHETYSIREKNFQLLVCNKDPFIKPEAALSEHLSLNTKTFDFSNVLFATNDHQESFEKKTNQVVVNQKTHNKKNNTVHTYMVFT